MTREEQIIEAGTYHLCGWKPPKTHGHNMHELAYVSRNLAFEAGAKWADENPDSKHTYTKQQLIDMGFAFTTNGDIVTPDQLNEDLKKYLEYQKRKFIEKAKAWLENTLYIHTEIEEDKDWCETKTFDWVTSDYESVEDFINSFCKTMEE